MSQAPLVTQKISADLGMPFKLCSSLPWLDTGIDCQKGQRYMVTAVASKNYSDSKIQCDADGPTKFIGKCFDFIVRQPRRWNPIRWVCFLGIHKGLRVLRDGTEERKRARFLTLIACIGQDDQQANAITVGRERSFVAHADGTLFLFANDWPGGTGTMGDQRFLRNNKTLPTYGNNQGYLTVTVSLGAPKAKPRDTTGVSEAS